MNRYHKKLPANKLLVTRGYLAIGGCSSKIKVTKGMA